MTGKLFDVVTKSPGIWVLESSGEKHDGNLRLRVGVRMQEMGKLFRTATIKIDPTNIASFRDDLNKHGDEVRELASAIADVLDWCDRKRVGTFTEGDPDNTFTRVLMQEWPVMFHCQKTATRLKVFIYGRDLLRAEWSVKTNYAMGWKFFKKEITTVADTFWDHLDHIDNIRFQDLTKGM